MQRLIAIAVGSSVWMACTNEHVLTPPPFDPAVKSEILVLAKVAPDYWALGAEGPEVSLAVGEEVRWIQLDRSEAELGVEPGPITLRQEPAAWLTDAPPRVLHRWLGTVGNESWQEDPSYELPVDQMFEPRCGHEVAHDRPLAPTCPSWMSAAEGRCVWPEHVPCEPGSARFSLGAACEPIAAACPSGDFADLPSGAAYVDVRALPGGDGSMAMPIATIDEALAIADVIALGPGTHRTDLAIDPSVRIVGLCPDRTTLASTHALRVGGALEAMTVEAKVITTGAASILRGVKALSELEVSSGMARVERSTMLGPISASGGATLALAFVELGPPSSGILCSGARIDAEGLSGQLDLAATRCPIRVAGADGQGSRNQGIRLADGSFELSDAWIAGTIASSGNAQVVLHRVGLDGRNIRTSALTMIGGYLAESDVAIVSDFGSQAGESGSVIAERVSLHAPVALRYSFSKVILTDLTTDIPGDVMDRSAGGLVLLADDVTITRARIVGNGAGRGIDLAESGSVVDDLELRAWDQGFAYLSRELVLRRFSIVDSTLGFLLRADATLDAQDGEILRCGQWLGRCDGAPHFERIQVEACEMGTRCPD